MPSSTHKLTRTWIGPCVVVKKNIPFSYVIEVHGKQQLSHANHLRKYNERVIEATVHNCAIIFYTDRDFGHVPTLDIQSDENLNRIAMNSNTHNCGSLVYDDLTYDGIDSMSDDNHAGQLYVDSDDVTLDFSDATPSQFNTRN